MLRKEECNLKLTEIYYTYFIECMLFGGRTSYFLSDDFRIEENQSVFLEQLDLFVNKAIYRQCYPHFAIERLKVLIKGIEKFLSTPELKQYLKKIEWQVATTQFEDGMDIYYEEYTKRYGKVTPDYTFVSLKQLEFDIQVDFVYLDFILQENISKNKKVEPDFLNFLNKILIDFPEMIEVEEIQKNILQILENNDLKGKEKYQTLLNDKSSYVEIKGFWLEKTERFYFLTLLMKLIFSSEVTKEIEKLPKSYFYHESFLRSLEVLLNQYVYGNSISLHVQNNLLLILNAMLENSKSVYSLNSKELTESLETCKKAIQNIKFIVPLEKEYKEEYKKRIGWGFLKINQKKEDEVQRHIEMTPVVFDYLIGKRELDSIDLDSTTILRILNYLFFNYPRMFFEDTLYQNALCLLHNLKNGKGQLLERKILKIRGVQNDL